MAEYRFSPKARRDLNDIFDYSVARWELDQALRYDMLIETACSEIAKTPLQAPSCDHIRPGYKRWRVEQHAIYFRQTRYGIAIALSCTGGWMSRGIFNERVLLCLNVSYVQNA